MRMATLRLGPLIGLARIFFDFEFFEWRCLFGNFAAKLLLRRLTQPRKAYCDMSTAGFTALRMGPLLDWITRWMIG